MRKAMLLIVVAIATLTVLGGLSGCGTTGILTPLPRDINIIAPDPSLGKIAECSGAWSGNWDNPYFQATTVVLEKIDRAEVIAVYAFGPYNGYSGGSLRVVGKIKNDSVVLEWGDVNAKRTVTLTPVGDKLHAEYRRGGRINRAVLTKVPTPAPK